MMGSIDNRLSQFDQSSSNLIIRSGNKTNNAVEEDIEDMEILKRTK